MSSKCGCSGLKNNLENLYHYKEIESFGKIAYLESGSLKEQSVSTHFLYKHILQYVDLYNEFHSLDLSEFCAVVLPMGIDEYYLSRFKDKILSFLESGGVVLSFMSDFMRILPYSKGYIQSQIPIRDRVVKFAKSESAAIIFDGVREYDVNHRRGVKGFFNRGFFDMSAFPHKVEYLLVDCRGECVGYIDRESTQGVILSTANADLLSFGLMDNTTARRMGLNLLRWLGYELERIKQDGLTHKTDKRGEQKSKAWQNACDMGLNYLDFVPNKHTQSLSSHKLANAIITGGSSFHRYFFTNKNEKYAHFFSKRCHFLDLQSLNLEAFDYIVLSSRMDAHSLLKHKEKFISYLESGGHIVSFGEIAQDYLPNIRWRDYPVNFWWWLIPNADMPLYALDSDGNKAEDSTKDGLFSKMAVKDAKWHYHGAFYPPKTAQNILVNELDESIIYKDTTFKGNLYVTSLDPEFHLGQGFMPTTEYFFDTFMQWVESDILENDIVCAKGRQQCVS